MQFTGFISEEDVNIPNAKTLKEMLSYDLNIEKFDRSKIIKYLENGHFLTGAMSHIYDNEGKSIGNLNYYTDGEYIWPIYYRYYLEKYKNFYIDKYFFEHAKKNNFSINKISKQRMIELEAFFISHWSKKK